MRMMPYISNINNKNDAVYKIFQMSMCLYIYIYNKTKLFFALGFLLFVAGVVHC